MVTGRGDMGAGMAAADQARSDILANFPSPAACPAADLPRVTVSQLPLHDRNPNLPWNVVRCRALSATPRLTLETDLERHDP